MTLDEAIKHAEEVAERKDKEAYDLKYDYDMNVSDIVTECETCADEHRQLAEWLKDYKRLLEQQPNKDSVSRQAVIESIGSNIHINFEGQRGLEKYEEDVKLIIQCMLDEQIKRVKELSPVVPTQRVGKWIDCGFVDKSFRMYKCSNCSDFVYEKEYLIKHHKYCLHCGSRNEKE